MSGNYRRKERGVRPTEHICSTLVKAYTRSGRYPEAIDFCQLVIDGGVPGVRANIYIYNGKAIACRDNGQTSEAIKICTDVIEGDVPHVSANIYTYNILADAYIEDGRPSAAMDRCQDIIDGKRPGITANESTRKALKKATDLLRAQGGLDRVVTPPKEVGIGNGIRKLEQTDSMIERLINKSTEDVGELLRPSGERLPERHLKPQRQAAVLILGRRADPTCLKMVKRDIAHALQDPNAYVREFAAVAFCWLNDPDPTIIRALGMAALDSFEREMGIAASAAILAIGIVGSQNIQMRDEAMREYDELARNIKERRAAPWNLPAHKINLALSMIEEGKKLLKIDRRAWITERLKSDIREFPLYSLAVDLARKIEHQEIEAKGPYMNEFLEMVLVGDIYYMARPGVKEARIAERAGVEYVSSPGEVLQPAATVIVGKAEKTLAAIERGIRKWRRWDEMTQGMEKESDAKLDEILKTKERKDADNRIAAMFVVARQRRAGYLDDIGAKFWRDGNSFVREMAAVILGYLGEVDIVPSLSARVSHCLHKDMFIEAAASILAIGAIVSAQRVDIQEDCRASLRSIRDEKRYELWGDGLFVVNEAMRISTFNRRDRVIGGLQQAGGSAKMDEFVRDAVLAIANDSKKRVPYTSKFLAMMFLEDIRQMSVDGDVVISTKNGAQYVSLASAAGRAEAGPHSRASARGATIAGEPVDLKKPRGFLSAKRLNEVIRRLEAAVADGQPISIIVRTGLEYKPHYNIRIESVFMATGRVVYITPTTPITPEVDRDQIDVGNIIFADTDENSIRSVMGDLYEAEAEEDIVSVLWRMTGRPDALTEPDTGADDYLLVHLDGRIYVRRPTGFQQLEVNDSDMSLLEPLLGIMREKRLRDLCVMLDVIKTPDRRVQLNHVLNSPTEFILARDGYGDIAITRDARNPFRVIISVRREKTVAITNIIPEGLYVPPEKRILSVETAPGGARAIGEPLPQELRDVAKDKVVVLIDRDIERRGRIRKFLVEIAGFTDANIHEFDFLLKAQGAIEKADLVIFNNPGFNSNFHELQSSFNLWDPKSVKQLLDPEAARDRIEEWLKNKKTEAEAVETKV